MGEFVILDDDRKEMIRAGRYYGKGLTNNEAESFALWDTLDCLTKLIYREPELQYPVSPGLELK